VNGLRGESGVERGEKVRKGWVEGGSDGGGNDGGDVFAGGSV